MPLLSITTAANGSERQQVMPLINHIIVKNNQPGRSRKRVKVLAADKDYDSKNLRAALHKALRGKLPPEDFTKTWYQTTVAKTQSKTKRNPGRPIKISVPRFQIERCERMVSTEIP